MKNAEYILFEWNKQISCYYKLNFDEAQKLYIKMINSSGNLKELLRERLITGTLYLIPKFISKSLLPYLKSNSYDMNDIINTCNELLINIIDSGKLLEITSFKSIFNEDFYKNITLELSSQYDLYNDIGVNNGFYIDAVTWYINESIKGREIDYECFLEYLNNYMKGYEDKIYDVLPCRDTFGVYNIIVKIYNYFKICGLVNKKISSRQIKFLKDMILENILNMDSDFNNIRIDDFSDVYIKEVLEEKILNIIFNDMSLSEREKDILRCRYGLDDGHFKTEKDAGAIFGISRAGVDISVKRTIKRIKKRGKEVLPLIEDYFNE